MSAYLITSPLSLSDELSSLWAKAVRLRRAGFLFLAAHQTPLSCLLCLNELLHWLLVDLSTL